MVIQFSQILYIQLKEYWLIHKGKYYEPVLDSCWCYQNIYNIIDCQLSVSHTFIVLYGMEHLLITYLI